MRRDIRREVTYRHPPERVWRALTSREALAAWLMPNDFEPKVGHRFNFKTDPAPGFDGIVHCEVRELEAPRRMVWHWKGGPIDTVVTFELDPIPDGTRLRFSQTGFEGASAVLVSFILGSGFGGLYRINLPRVLDRMARGQPLAPEPNEREPGGAQRWIAKLVERISG